MTFKELQDALSDWLAMNEKRLPVSARKQLINLALVDIQRRALWRFCLHSQQLTIPSNTNTVAHPADMIEPESVTYYHPTTNELITLEFLPPGEFKARFGDSIAIGYPTKYTVGGSSFIMNAKPPQYLNLTVSYYRLLPALVSDNDTNAFTDIAWDAVLFTALELASLFGIEDARAPLFAQKKEQALTKLLVSEGRLGASTYRPKSRLQDEAAV